MSTGGVFRDAEQVQITRVEGLLGTVRDMVSSLARTSAQLESELRHLLQPGESSVLGQEFAQRLAAVMTENAQLREAMESRLVIEQAKGMLMLGHGCGPDEAFELLVATSRQQRRKVREVAACLVRQVLSEGRLPDAEPTSTPATGPASIRALRGAHACGAHSQPSAADPPKPATVTGGLP
ncbi:MAG TPA: ANTAR domain-containing protein [Kineosporiaceae bacterium]|nr:ANTAR domain-containing protein [Kineosporiaceae bacterium]